MSEEQAAEGSWFQKGYGGVKGEEDRIATKYGPQRFWMPAKETKTIVFLDDEPACIHEHNPKMGGSWKNWSTCIRDVYPDGYYSVIDCTKWQDKKGNTYQFEVKLYGAKLKTLKLLQTKMQEDWGGSMTGKVIKIRRTSSDDASVGNDFTLDRDADMEKLWALATYKGKKIADLYAKALEDEDERHRLSKTFAFKKGENGVWLPEVPTFNYWEVLKPKTPSEMRTFLKAGGVEDPNDSASPSGGGEGKADENVPF
jgi:hypothetical protein